MDAVKPFLFTLLLISGGIVSIGISAWQYSIQDNGITFLSGTTGKQESLTTICTHFPYNWMRPFRMSVQGHSNDAYCGYSAANTGFRLALACATVIFGAALVVLRSTTDIKLVTYWGLFVVSVLWYAASVADIIAFIQGSQGCSESLKDNFIDDSIDITCNSSEYGITVAVDVLMSFIMCFCWVLAGKSLQETSVPTSTGNPVADHNGNNGELVRF